MGRTKGQRYRPCRYPRVIKSGVFPSYAVRTQTSLMPGSVTGLATWVPQLQRRNPAGLDDNIGSEDFRCKPKQAQPAKNPAQHRGSSESRSDRARNTDREDAGVVTGPRLLSRPREEVKT